MMSVDSATGNIVGKVGNTLYFTISNNGSTVKFEQSSENIKHGNTTNPDDAESINAVTNSIVLKQTITDADGDSASVDLDLSKDVFTIKDDGPTVDVTSKTGNILLQESFELSGGWSISSGNWAVNGNNGDVTGDNGAVWKFDNNAGVEIQSGVVSDSDDGIAHAELDPHTKGTNTSMSTEVSLTSSKEYTLEFAYQARAFNGSKETADMKVTFAGKELIIDSDENGNLTVTTNPNDASIQYSLSTVSADGWTTFTIVYKGVTGDSNNKATLSFEGLDTADTYGALLDDIKLVDTPKLIVDETDLSIDAKADYSLLFAASSNAGTDGTKSYDTTYTLEVGNVNSGLIDTQTNQAVLLKVDAGKVVGYINDNGIEKTVFELSVDSNGVITLDQQRSVVHSDSTDHDDSISILDNNAIKLTRKDTITDKDDDTAMDSETVGIATTLTFKDDGPTIDIDKVSGTEPTITVDETLLTLDRTADFSSMFTLVSKDAGEDGEQSHTIEYTLNIKSANVDSGLVHTATNEAVLLSKNSSGVIEGKTASGILVFTLLVDASGKVTLDQKEEVKHPQTTNHNDTVSLSADDLITLTRKDTLVDKDGDKDVDTATLNIGKNLKFKDDGPSIEDSSKMVDEDALVGGSPDADSYDPDVKEVTGKLKIDAGEDGLQSLEFIPQTTLTASNVSGNLTSEGEEIVVSTDGTQKLIGTAHGETIFEITLDSSTQKYTFKLIGNIDHPTMNVEDLIEDISFEVKATDKDGDISKAEIKIDIADDIPSSSSSSVVLDAKVSPINLVFTLDISGSMGSLVGNTGKDRLQIAKEAIENLVSEYQALGHDVLIQVNTFSTTAFGNGTWMTASQLNTYLAQINDGGWTNYEDALQKTEANYSTPATGGKTYAYFLSDGKPTVEMDDSTSNPDDVTSGDTQDGIDDFLDTSYENNWNSFISNPANKIEKVFAIGIGTKVDTNYLSQVSSDVIEVDNPADLSSTLQGTIVTASGSLTFDFGADKAADGAGIKADGGKLAFTWGDANTSNGFSEIVTTGTNSPITWSLTGGTVLVGTINGKTVVKVEAQDILTNNPKYSITEFDKNAGITSLKIPFTVTDGDGDSSTSNLNIQIDAKPTILGDTNTVYEKGLTSVADTSEISSGTFKITSIDGIAKVTIGTASFTQAQLEATNTAPSTPINTGEGTLVITAYNKATGEVSYQYTLNSTIDNDSKVDATPTQFVDNIILEVEDNDGDKSTGVLKVTIIDDVPTIDVTATNESSIILTTQDADTKGANQDKAESTADFSGVFDVSFNYGADVVAGNAKPDLSYKLLLVGNAPVTSGFTHEGQAIKLSITAAGVVEGKVDGIAEPIFTISVNNDGKVTLTQNAELDHGTPGSATDTILELANGLVELEASSTITDADGDSKTDKAKIDLGGNIKFEDDVPVANADVRTMRETTDKITGNVYGGAGARPGDNADDIGADSNNVPTVITGVSTGTDISNPVSGNVGQVVQGKYGTLTLNADGSYTYDLDNNNATVKALVDNQEVNDLFVYTIKDSDGDSSTTTLRIAILGTDNKPTMTPERVQVDEDALVGSASDTQDDGVDNVKTVTASLGITSPDGVASIEFGGQNHVWPENGYALRSEGEKVAVTKVNAHKMVGTAHGETIFEITINETTQEYTFKLLGNVDHPDKNAEDVINSLTFPIRVTDSDGDFVVKNAKVDIADDTPIANEAKTTIDLTEIKSNLIFTLDVSGSMANSNWGGVVDDGNGGTTTRFEIARASIIETINAYKANGTTMVNLTLFNTDGKNYGWMTPAQAIEFLGRLSMSDGVDSQGNPNYLIKLDGQIIPELNEFRTDFADALEATSNISFANVQNADNTVAYFITDGEPTDSDDNSKDDINDNNQIIKDWKAFIDANVDKLNVVGVGSGINSDAEKYLKVVQVQDGDEIIVVSQDSTLGEVLLNTVVNKSGTLDFDFGADKAADGAGSKADGGKLAFTWGDANTSNGFSEIVVTGTNTPITWSLTGGTVLVGTINGKTVAKVEAQDILTNNPTYKITQIDKSTGITGLKIPFTVTDGDGDSVSSNLDITILRNIAPTTTDDKITLHEDNVYTINVNDFGTYSDANGNAMQEVRIETLPNNGTLSLNGVAIVAGREISVGDINAGKLKFTPKVNTDDDSTFNFKVSDGKDWSTTKTTTVEVKAIADAPRVNIDVTSELDVNNLDNYDIKAFDKNGNPATLSPQFTGEVKGVGVIGAGSGNDKELGESNGKSESIVVTLGAYATSIKADLGWLRGLDKNGHNAEYAKIEFFKDNQLVTYKIVQGKTDTTDSYSFDNIPEFNKIRFSAPEAGPKDGNDYLVSKLSFENPSGDTLYNVHVNASLADKDGSESLSVRLEGVPNGANFTSSDMKSLGNGVWELEVPANTTDINKILTMSVPSGTNPNFNITAVAQATEVRDNSEAQTLAFDDDTIDLTGVLSQKSEAVDLSKDGAQTLNVNLDDIIITEDNELKIFSDDTQDTDTVRLEGGNSKWTKSANQETDENGNTFDVYTGTASNNENVKVLIDTSIDPEL